MTNVYTGFPLLVLLAWCCTPSLSGWERLGVVQTKLQQLIRQKNRNLFRRTTRADLPDLRGHKLFASDPRLDCCPTLTEVSERVVGVNPQGMLLELFHTENFTQTFYETVCHPVIKDRPCQYIDSRVVSMSRCVQQHSYVYALARTFGNHREQFRIDYIRVGTGCKCEMTSELLNIHDLDLNPLEEQEKGNDDEEGEGEEAIVISSETEVPDIQVVHSSTQDYGDVDTSAQFV